MILVLHQKDYYSLFVQFSFICLVNFLKEMFHNHFLYFYISYVFPVFNPFLLFKIGVKFIDWSKIHNFLPKNNKFALDNNYLSRRH